MSVSGFFSAAFYLADDVFTNQANGLVQIASEVVERTQGHHAGRKIGDSEMEVDNFSFLDDFFFKICDELFLFLIGLSVDAVGHLHSKSDLSFGGMLRIVVQYFFFDRKLALHFTEPFQFVLHHLR